MSDSAHKNRMSFLDRNGSRRVSINAPRMLDYSSDENSDDGDDGSSSIPRPVHRNDLDYAKLASRASMTNRQSRKTFSGRRGSMIFGGRASMASRASVSFNAGS